MAEVIWHFPFNKSFSKLSKVVKATDSNAPRNTISVGFARVGSNPTVVVLFLLHPVVYAVYFVAFLTSRI
jgi:hypothetical protein